MEGRLRRLWGRSLSCGRAQEHAAERRCPLQVTSSRQRRELRRPPHRSVGCDGFGNGHELRRIGYGHELQPVEKRSCGGDAAGGLGAPQVLRREADLGAIPAPVGRREDEGGKLRPGRRAPGRPCVRSRRSVQVELWHQSLRARSPLPGRAGQCHHLSMQTYEGCHDPGRTTRSPSGRH